MTEERITKAILNWLEDMDWQIICFDFPQSGTGKSLHPNADLRETKNKSAWIPDIVAFRKYTVLFFENKTDFSHADIVKLNEIKSSNIYSESTERLLKNLNHRETFYGIGLQNSTKNLQQALRNKDLIDFAILINEDKTVLRGYDKNSVFSD